MGTRRPPDILRKSHAHVSGNERAKGKRGLEEALDVALDTPPAPPALLIDLDGVVYRGEEVIAGAADVVKWLSDEGIAHLFVTNTTSRPREALVDKLSQFGLEVSAEEILAPPGAAAAWLQAHGIKHLLLAVPETVADAFDAFETLTLDDAVELQGKRDSLNSEAIVDAVIVGDMGPGWSVARLNATFRCLMQVPQPKLIALGMTRYWRAADGLRLDTAPFVVALSHASGADPVVLGKPAAAFFEAALDILNVKAGDTWMLGDDIRADIAGAQAAGLKGILVRTGKFRPTDLELGIEPDLVIDSIADLPEAFSLPA